MRAGPETSGSTVRLKDAHVSGRAVKQPFVEYEEVTFRLAA